MVSRLLEGRVEAVCWWGTSEQVVGLIVGFRTLGACLVLMQGAALDVPVLRTTLVFSNNVI